MIQAILYCRAPRMPARATLPHQALSWIVVGQIEGVA